MQSKRGDCFTESKTRLVKQKLQIRPGNSRSRESRVHRSSALLVSVFDARPSFWLHSKAAICPLLMRMLTFNVVNAEVSRPLARSAPSRCSVASEMSRCQLGMHSAVGHLQEMFPQHSVVSLVHLLERLRFDVVAATEQLLSMPDSISSKSPCTSVVHLSVNPKVALQFSPELEDADTSDNLQVTTNTATSAPSSPAQRQLLQTVPQQHTHGQSSLGLLWSEPTCRVAHVPLINPTPTLIQAARPRQACSPHVIPSPAVNPPVSKDPLAFLDDFDRKSASGTTPSASPVQALFFQGQPPSAPAIPMASASTQPRLSSASASISAATTAGHTGQLRYQSVPDFDDNNSDSDWSDAEDSAGGGPANFQPSHLLGDAHTPRDAFEKLAVLGEPFQKLGLEVIACTLQEAGFDVTLASDRCLALLNSQSNIAEHAQEAEERVQANSNLLLVSWCSNSGITFLLLNRMNSVVVAIHDSQLLCIILAIPYAHRNS